MAAVAPLHVRSNGRTLAGRFFYSSASRPGVRFIHGLHSNQNGYWERAEAVTERIGAVCLTFDLAGHGESDGAPETLSVEDHLADVIAAYDRLTAERDVDSERIGVAGAS